MSYLAVLHASQLVTLAGPNRPRVGSEMSDLAIIRKGGMLICDLINGVKNKYEEIFAPSRFILKTSKPFFKILKNDFFLSPKLSPART